MPKKLFAVTNIKFSGDPADFVPAGEALDASKFDKEDLVKLHDAGAIEVRVVEDEVEAARPSPLDDDSVTVVDPAAEAKAKAEAEEKAAEEKKAAEAKAAEDDAKAATQVKTTPTSTPAKSEGSK